MHSCASCTCLIGDEVEDSARLVKLHHKLKGSGLNILCVRCATRKDGGNVVHCFNQVGDEW